MKELEPQVIEQNSNSVHLSRICNSWSAKQRYSALSKHKKAAAMQSIQTNALISLIFLTIRRLNARFKRYEQRKLEKPQLDHAEIKWNSIMYLSYFTIQCQVYNIDHSQSYYLRRDQGHFRLYNEVPNILRIHFLRMCLYDNITHPVKLKKKKKSPMNCSEAAALTKWSLSIQKISNLQ